METSKQEKTDRKKILEQVDEIRRQINDVSSIKEKANKDPNFFEDLEDPEAEPIEESALTHSTDSL